MGSGRHWRRYCAALQSSVLSCLVLSIPSLLIPSLLVSSCLVSSCLVLSHLISSSVEVLCYFAKQGRLQEKGILPAKAGGKPLNAGSKNAAQPTKTETEYPAEEEVLALYAGATLISSHRISSYRIASQGPGDTSNYRKTADSRSTKCLPMNR